MDGSGIAITASAAAALGFGASAGYKLIPALIQARRDLAVLREADRGDTDEEARSLHPSLGLLGCRRETSIVGLYRDALRHADGSFTRAYHAELAPTIFGDDYVVEMRCNALARLLAARKPVGTVIQFRLSTAVDPGLAVVKHNQARDAAGVHPLAAILHDEGLGAYLAMAASGNFRRSVLTCWVRVPNLGRKSAEDLFLPTLKREFNNRGLLGLPQAFAESWKASSAQAVVKRTLAEEATAFAEAEKTFRLIETALKFTPFSGEELWTALFLGHRMNAASVPTIPADGADIREYLCGETIESCGHYVMHGDCPAAIVSMFTPPQPFITADALRLLSVNGTLNFRHTIVSEFIYPDQNKGIKRLDRRIRQVMRSAQSISGRYKLSPEASVALQDLGAIRQELVGGREALAQVIFYVVVYGEQARTKAELAVSLQNLDRHCEQVVAEIRKIGGADADREEPAALSPLSKGAGRRSPLQNDNSRDY